MNAATSENNPGRKFFLACFYTEMQLAGQIIVVNPAIIINYKIPRVPKLQILCGLHKRSFGSSFIRYAL